MLDCTHSLSHLVILFIGKPIKYIKVSRPRGHWGPNCLEQLHLGPPPTHSLLIGPSNHLSSGLGLTHSLSHSVSVLVSSSDFQLDCGLVLLITWLSAGSWSCVRALSLDKLLLFLAWSIPSAGLWPLLNHVAALGSVCHVQTCETVPWVRALSSWVPIQKKEAGPCCVLQRQSWWRTLRTSCEVLQVGLLYNYNTANACQTSKMSCMELVGGKAFPFG